MSDCLWPHELQPTRLLCPWDSPGKNTGVGCPFFLQGIFPIQELDWSLLHGRWILYHWATRDMYNLKITFNIRHLTLQIKMSEWDWIKNQGTELWNCLNNTEMTLSQQPPRCPLPGKRGGGTKQHLSQAPTLAPEHSRCCNWAITLVYLNCPIRWDPCAKPGPRVLKACPGSVTLWLVEMGLSGVSDHYRGSGLENISC